MAELRPIILFHGRHFVHHLEICNPICVKLLQVMSGGILRNLRKTSISNSFPGVHKRGIHTHRQTHTHTHDDSIRRNAMRCISPKNLQEQLVTTCTYYSDIENVGERHRVWLSQWLHSIAKMTRKASVEAGIRRNAICSNT